MGTRNDSQCNGSGVRLQPFRLVYLSPMDKLVIANWKMNPATREEAEKLASGYRSRIPRTKGVSVIVCPPLPYIGLLHDLTPAFRLGAQDMFWEDAGAYTGSIGPLMLKNLSVSWVIIGHSELRAVGETDEQISKKIESAQAHGLMTILCVGESAELHKQKPAAIQKFIETQLDLGLARMKDPALLVVAYEPIWAISKGGDDNADDAADALERIAHIKQYLGTKLGGRVPPVIYGGSVAPHNAHSFFKYKAIDGVLVGSASLDAAAMQAIVQSAVNAATESPTAHLEKD